MEYTALIQINEHDQEVISMWLHGRSEHTQHAYNQDVQKLLSFAGKTLQDTTLQDLQRFSDSLDDLSDATRSQSLNAVKSLLSFAHELGVRSIQCRCRSQTSKGTYAVSTTHFNRGANNKPHLSNQGQP